MILACGCDTIWTSYFDRCGKCRERLSTEADAKPVFPAWEKELRQGVEDRRVDMLDAYPSKGLKWQRGAK